MNLVMVGNLGNSQLKHGGNDTTSFLPRFFLHIKYNIIPAITKGDYNNNTTSLHISPYFNTTRIGIARYGTNSAKKMYLIFEFYFV